jgi:hypothetical protein
VVVGKGKSDLGFWERKGEGEKGKRGRLEGEGRLAAGKGESKGESNLGFLEGEVEGEKGKAGGGGGGRLTTVKGENDLGLEIVLFTLFFKPVRFGPVQSI